MEKIFLKDLVSIIVPIYNVEKFLPRCIESICNQTYENIEILLINDGSTDESEQICVDFMARDPRIRYFLKENGGLSDARNYGIERACGKYLAFIDSDDFVESDFILRLYDALVQQNASVAIAGFSKVDENGTILKKEQLENEELVLTGREVCKKLHSEKGQVFVVAWNKLYKKELFTNLKYAKGKLHEDEYLAYQLFYEIERIAIVEECLYYYVERRESITRTQMTDLRFECLIEYQLLRIDFFNSKNDSELLTLNQQAFLLFVIQFLEQNRSGFVTPEKKAKLRGLYTKIYKELMNQNSKVHFLHRLFYLLGYLNLDLAVFLYRIKV
ncbi:TPA: glycosyltransferase family 2 protein [Streptococcus suis]|nr:glycosyltransferase family 2 protein [Streptococcus suis]HEM6112621.1 glycosyltransferase family 2 protein [Streptococcus suis]HEM6320511.1 glycosyltransferase family 2 protein [Streptococcus suis]